MIRDLVWEVEKVRRNFGKAQFEAYVAGIETGLHVGKAYLESGLCDFSFARSLIVSNITAIRERSDNFPYGKVVDGYSLRLGFGVPYGSLLPEKWIVREGMLKVSDAAKVSYLEGCLDALSILFEVKGEIENLHRELRSEILEAYIERLVNYIRSLPS